MSPITEQPSPFSHMNSTVRPEQREKDTRHKHSHKAAHSIRRRRLLLLALVILLTVAVLFLFDIRDIVSEGSLRIGAGSGLLQRADTVPATSSTHQGDTNVDEIVMAN
ncbi:hypothetical protein BU17DRAFT_85847 [Hysterangium stoloniferum]|nr:hypothetical protein BU17DRAFT_85847 [Hysterangium stoloniferum]